MKVINLDPITNRFVQITQLEKVCYICGSNKHVDDHHIDCQEGRISPETVSMCRRCHKTYHIWGVNWFEDEYLDKIIEIANKRRVLLDLPLMKRENIKRSHYWNKKHGIKTTIVKEKGNQTPPFRFNLPKGEPLCGWDWVNEHLYDLLDYVPRIEVVTPSITFTKDVVSVKELKEVGRVLRGLKVERRDGNKRKVITLDPISNVFSEVA